MSQIHRLLLVSLCTLGLWSGAAGGARLAEAANSVTLQSVSGYGNLQAGGVTATIAGDDNQDATATLEWRPSGGTFKAAHPLSRIDATHFAGSLFSLAPGTDYDVRVTVSDADGVTGSPSATALLQTRADTLPAPTLRTLYVSPIGNDLNLGTSLASALRTVQRAADLAQSGDLVLIQPGVYRERVTVARSGTASQPIVFRGDGAGAILDGADAAIAAGVSWSTEGSGVYSYATGFGTGHVVTENGRLYRYGTQAELQALAAGAPGGFFFDGTRLYVKFADSSTPSSHTLHVGRLDEGLVIDGRSFVRVENLEVRHYGSGDYGKGIYLRYASDVVVRSCRIHEIGAAGVWVKGGDRHRIEDNDIWDTSIFGWPWDLSKGSSAENNAVYFTDDVGRGHVVRRNTIHGTFNGVGPCGLVAPPSGVTNETDLYENVLSQHTDDAFEPEGYCSNVRIWGNEIRDSHMAFAVAPAAPGPLYILRNVAYRFGNTRTSQQDGYTASALKINSGYATTIGPLFLYHNTFLTDAANTDAIALLNPGTSSAIKARNNVFAGTQYALYKVNPVALDWNGDDVYTTDTTRFVYWEGARYTTLAAFQSATGQEAGGISAAPQLVDPPGGNFFPAALSPLIDRGLVLPGINDGYSGAAPDIGAYETGGPPALSVNDVSVTEGNSGTQTAVFTVTLSGSADQPVTVDFATADGTASAGSDYVATSGQRTFAVGVSTQTISVTVNGDTAVEPSETFVVTLSAATNATIADLQGQGTITNDDSAPSSKAVMLTPVPASTLSGSTVTFTWSTGSGVTAYWLEVGTTPGGKQIYPGASTTALSATVSGLPTNGSTVYTRLWSFLGGSWTYNDYTYTASGGGSSSKAVMQTPVPGSTLPGSTATFTWSTGIGVTAYWLEVGTTVGGRQIYPGASTTALSATVSGLPTNGTVYVRLWSLLGGSWVYNDYTYTASGGGSSSKAVMQTPPPGSTLAGSTVIFTWSTGSGVTAYWLEVGTTPGGKQIYPGASTTSLSATVTGLPTSGTVYARLWSLLGGSWVYNDYTYTAGVGGSSSKAVMQTPVPGSTLPGPTATFTWSTGGGVTAYWLEVGTTLGGRQIYPGASTTALSATVSGLPASGTVYTRLWSFLGGSWVYTDYTYTASSGGSSSKAVMQTPAPGSTLPGSTVTFTWNTGSGVSTYWLELGTTPGGRQIYPGASTTALSATVSGLPMNGSTVYARLWSLLGGSWAYNDYTYIASGGGSSSKAVMQTPAPGSTLAGSTVMFTWNAGVGPTAYWLEVGTTLGGKQIYPGSQTTSLSAAVSGLPTNGSTVYVRLWSLLNAVWVYNDYTYTAAP